LKFLSSNIFLKKYSFLSIERVQFSKLNAS